MTELVFILDRSGSMSGLEADTIGGFNSMIARQKQEAGEALVSTVLFDNESVVIHDRLPLAKVPLMTEKEYFTRGCTALLDAVGGAIHHIGNIHKYARREDVPEKTLFVITTDGYENASRRYNYETVRRLSLIHIYMCIRDSGVSRKPCQQAEIFGGPDRQLSGHERLGNTSGGTAAIGPGNDHTLQRTERNARCQEPHRGN